MKQVDGTRVRTALLVGRGTDEEDGTEIYSYIFSDPYEEVEFGNIEGIQLEFTPHDTGYFILCVFRCNKKGIPVDGEKGLIAEILTHETDTKTLLGSMGYIEQQHWI